jgi:BirA family transcriptional regulator, biotin operon repressor / biotin---[acetyl-CoA-carboxylase] ligase
VSDSLAAEQVEPYLRGSFGKPYLYEPDCESTQLLLLGSGLPEGAVAATDHQTAGKGRHGRRWVAPASASVLASVMLHPPVERQLPELSLIAALAAAQTIEEATGLSAQIKWPNDVMLNRRKVAGILSELSDGTVVVGIGVNVNQSRDELPADTTTPAGSLRSLTGQTYDRGEVLASLLFRLEHTYDAWKAGGLAALYGDVGARDFLRGRRITVDGQPATALQILRDGRLEVATGNGHGQSETRVVESGEVLFER